MSVMKVAALLLLVLFIVKADDADVKTEWTLNEVDKIPAMSFNISLPEDRYTSFMFGVDRQLALTTTKPHIEKRPVLGVQKFRPDNWVNVTLTGRGHAACTLAIRADTLYLVGFKPQGGSWYAFDNRKNLIHGSTSLGFTDDYKSLAGENGHMDLVNVAVGKKPAQEALDTLASYKHGSTSQIDTKKALVRFVVMFCEAARLQLIRADVSAAWDQEEGGKLRQVSVEVTVKWRDISCALLGSSMKKKWDSIKEANDIKNYGEPQMKSAKAAADNVYCILQAKDCSVPYN
ncbi:unnamed protein product [Urochloa decumbens]|uniref:rRNA N-glycosylase n=1 Tax=Urochloa decumbens TaxID=240449 RepID=A0ABC9ARL2_9POAL